MSKSNAPCLPHRVKVVLLDVGHHPDHHIPACHNNRQAGRRVVNGAQPARWGATHTGARLRLPLDAGQLPGPAHVSCVPAQVQALLLSRSLCTQRASCNHCNHCNHWIAMRCHWTHLYSGLLGLGMSGSTCRQVQHNSKARQCRDMALRHSKRIRQLSAAHDGEATEAGAFPAAECATSTA